MGRKVRRLWDQLKDRTPTGLSGDACWPWMGQLNSDGYGLIVHREASGERAKVFRASRVVLLFSTGVMRKGMVAMHSCDNPPCVNPSHLRWGSYAENAQDASTKGRLKGRTVLRGEQHYLRAHPELIKRGESHPQSTLTEADVREIYRLRMTGLSSHKIAAIMGISWQNAGFVWSGMSWKHMLKEPGAPSLEEMRGAVKRAKLHRALSSEPNARAQQPPR